MIFRTEIEKLKTGKKINYHDKLFFIGSCFANNIGGECTKHGLDTTINPFGVSYNPQSIASILYIIDKAGTIEDDMFRKVGDKYCSLMHHSDYDNKSLSSLKETVTHISEKAKKDIQSSSHIFITLGTAWVFTDNKTGVVVNNCHKINANEFTRSMLSVSGIVGILSKLLDNCDMLKGKNIILTVSPIRHKKDGLAGNSLSKAVLRAAVGELCELYPEQVSYFPSYEIVMDDLRDYRFYESDMIHPNQTAIDYIFSYFMDNLCESSTKDYATKMLKIQKAMLHRVSDSDSSAYSTFCKSTINKILDIQKSYPLVSYDKYINHFKF